MGYIYGLICPVSYQIRYIGQTTKELKERKRNHINSYLRVYKHKSKLTHKMAWFRQLDKVGKLKSIEIIQVEECDNVILYEREKFWIEEYRKNGFKLTNLKDGGFNPSGYKIGPMDEDIKIKISETLRKFWRGYKNSDEDSKRIENIKITKMERYGTLKSFCGHTEESKLKISKSITGENNPFYGKNHTEESKLKMSENHKDYNGENNPFYGKTHREETKKIIKEKRKNQIIKSRKIGLYDDISKKMIRIFENINEVMLFFNNKNKKRYYYTIVKEERVIDGKYLSYIIE
jgi:hypothetical protein